MGRKGKIEMEASNAKACMAAVSRAAAQEGSKIDKPRAWARAF
jgi:hypothetical protein